MVAAGKKTQKQQKQKRAKNKKNKTKGVEGYCVDMCFTILCRKLCFGVVVLVFATS